MSILHPATTRLQYILQPLLLLPRQTIRELDLDPDHEISTLVGLLALRHTQVWVAFCPVGTRGPAAADAELLAVDGLHGAAPAGQGFFEVEFDGAFDVVAFAGEEGVGFLGGGVSVCL